MYLYLRITEREDTLSYVERWPKGVDKITTLKKSWVSLQKSVSPDDTIVLIEDQCKKETIDWFEKTCNTFNLEILHVPAHEPLDYIHYHMLLDHLDKTTKQYENEVFLLLNDDYLYTDDALSVLKSIFDDGWNGFATMFDYPDRYSLDKQGTPLTTRLCEIFIGSKRHWRTIPSCPGITSAKGNMWQLNMLVIKQAAAYHSDSYTYLSYSKYGCVSPIPGVSSHLTPYHMTPMVDWQKIWNKIDIENND